MLEEDKLVDFAKTPEQKENDERHNEWIKKNFKKREVREDGIYFDDVKIYENVSKKMKKNLTEEDNLIDFTKSPEENAQEKEEWDKLTPEQKMDKKVFESLPNIKPTKKLFPPEEIKEILNDTFENIISILKKYVDLKEDYYILCAVWILGTYLHDSFNTYPYLFINAMRGSGKTKLLNLITTISHKGEVLASPTEAVLFRYPKGHTLGIDEFEGITRKGKEGLREMLNACYKKGVKVRRIKQIKAVGGNEQVIEEFEPYKPICMSNIYGTEEVLADRCITLILEKSERDDILRLIEDFRENLVIKALKSSLEGVLVQLCSYFGVEGYIEKWNMYVISKHSTLSTYNTYTTHTTLTTPQTTPQELDFFNKIDESGINGRELELFFPLLLISNELNEKTFDSLLNIAKKLTEGKRKEQLVESKDVSLYDFVSRQNIELEFRKIRDITIGFRNFLGNIEENEDKWINERWVGRALTRLNLYTNKRRLGSGIEVILDIEKAKRKLGKIK